MRSKQLASMMGGSVVAVVAVVLAFDEQGETIVYSSR